MPSSFQNTIYKTLLICISFAFVNGMLFAQSPQGLPKPSDNKPIDLSTPFSIIFYIVIPLIAIIAYVLLKRRKGRK